VSNLTDTITGLMSRNPAEISRVLGKASREGVPVRVYFPSLTFESLLVLVDAKLDCVILERSARAAANDAVLSRPRCTFHCEMAGWHIEFVAAAPRAVVLHRRQLIQCRFPELLASNPRRLHERVQARPPLPLRVEADAGGITPFEARIVDLAPGGVGFLVHAESITLEPGTLLRGCVIQLPGGSACTADFEVRYSEAVTLPNGRRVTRSGCRFVNPSPKVVEFVRRFLKQA
jgi:c-di-GMP-binding flagellar brake protein YcgR